MTERHDVDVSLDLVLREERTRLIASLVRILGDWDLAEAGLSSASLTGLVWTPLLKSPASPWRTGGTKRTNAKAYA